MRSHLQKGQQFGNWTVTGEWKVIEERRYHQCRCSCGTVRFVRAWNLISGQTKGCPFCMGKRMQKPGLRTCPDCKGVKSKAAQRCLKCEGLRRRKH